MGTVVESRLRVGQDLWEKGSVKQPISWREEVVAEAEINKVALNF